MENIRSAAKKGDGELENILRNIELMIVSIVGLGVLIFGIKWGYSLLVNELQSHKGETKGRKRGVNIMNIGKFSAEEVDLEATFGTRRNIAIEWAEMWIKYFSKHTAVPTWAPFEVICLYTAWVVVNSNRRERGCTTESEWKSDAKKILTQARIMYNGRSYF